MRFLSGKGKSASSTGCIRGEDGSILTEKKEVMQRWKRYIEELFDDQRGDIPQIQRDIVGPAINKDEIRHAINKMSKGKAVSWTRQCIDRNDRSIKRGRCRSSTLYF